MKNLKIENAIETKYRELEIHLTSEYVSLYRDFPDVKLPKIFSTLHNLLIQNYDKMNHLLPTGDIPKHFWADNSRALLFVYSTIDFLQQLLENTKCSFQLDSYYQTIFEQSKKFLSQSGGSQIPPQMNKIELYYKIPIFIKNNKLPIKLDVPTVEKINSDYIKSISSRALDDIKNGNFDSAITKSRTLLEEVFFYVIEQRQEQPPESGDINKLYRKVKDIYKMHENSDLDKRINKLLSGLEKIVSAITELRNNESDAHGHGTSRKRISDYHARLLANSAMTMADFILSVAQKANNTV